MNDLISVIIPVKDGAKYITQAINGILAQDMNCEIIVVDDASTDNTAEITASLGCKVIKHEVNKGQVAGKNTGLQAAIGKYVMFHDHDDVMQPGSLRRLYDFLEQNPETYMVMGKVKDFISPDSSGSSPMAKPDAYWGLFTGAVLMRKELFDKVGLFYENINTGEIIELQQKMQAAGLKTEKLDFISCMRRIHDSNYGRTSAKKEFQDYAAILRKRLMNKN